MYISLIETLKFLCKNELISQLIAFSPNSNSASEILAGVTDGSFCQTSPLHANNYITFKINLFVDDFEPVNGMGY